MLDTSASPDSEHDRLTRETLALFVPIIRAFEDGVLEQRASTRAVAEAAALVERGRATGDPTRLALALITQAILLANDGWPGEALPIALEADTIAREHGLGLYVDAASNAVSVALGRLAHPEADTDRAAHELHRRLTDAKRRRSHMMGVAMLGGIALLLVPRNPVTAYTLDLVRVRLQPGYTGLLPDPASVLDPDTVAQVRGRADRLDVPDAIDLALAALERLIDGDDDRQRSDQ